MKNILHCVLLKIINGSSFYVDYYSINFPVRKITDSIPRKSNIIEKDFFGTYYSQQV